MKLNREEMKELALFAMKKVGIYPPFIKQFQESNEITMFIAGLGYTIDERTKDNLLEIIRAVEADGDKIVYAVSKNTVGGDTVYALLLVADDDTKESVINEEVVDGMPAFEVLAYCHNADCDFCSEYGYVTIQNRYGGVRRIG